MDTIETAVYKLGMDDSSYTQGAARAADAGKALAATNDNVAVTEEKVSNVTRVRADSMDRLLGRLDPVLRAQQQYAAMLERINMLEEAGVGTATQHAEAIALAQTKYVESATAAAGVSVAEGVALSEGALIKWERAADRAAVMTGTLLPQFGALSLVSRALATTVEGPLVAAVVGVGAAFGILYTAIEKGTKITEAQKASFEGMAGAMHAAAAGGAFGAAGATIMDATQKGNMAFLGTAGAQMSNEGKQYEDQRQAAIKALDQIQKNAETAAKLKNEADKKYSEEHKKFLEEMQKVEDESDQRDAEALQEFADKRLELIDQADAKEAEALQQFHEEMNAKWDAYYAGLAEKAQKAADKQVAEQQKTAQEFQTSLEGTFQGFLKGLETGQKNPFQHLFAGILSDWENLMNRMITQSLFGDPSASNNGGGIIGGLLGLGGGILSGIFAPGQTAAQVSSITDITSGFGADAFSGSSGLFAGAFAGGGTIPPGGYALVGERGPELAYGGASGATISPFGKGSPTFTIVQNINGNSDRALAAAVLEAHNRAVATITTNFPQMMTNASQRNL